MADIESRALGRTGLVVSTLGFGAMELRGDQGGPQIDDADAGRLLNAVLDEGINFIDTSIDYGRSEELIGKFVSHRRSEFVLASKCGCVPGAPMGAEHVHTAANIRAGVENSLRRLGTDYLDLDPFQVPYSALQREHEHVLNRASDAGAGIIIRGGVARGAPDDWAARRYYMVPSETMRDYWDNAQLDELLDGMSRTAFMLRFTLSHPALDTTIVGTSSIEHLHDNLAAASRGPLPDEILAEAKTRLSAVGAAPQS